MKLGFEEMKAWPTVPTGWYTGVVRAIAMRDAPADKFHDAPYHKLEFSWAVQNDQGQALLDPETNEPITLKAWITVTRTFNEKSWIYKVCDALGLVKDGQLLSDDTDSWLGKSCLLSVIEDISGEGDAARVRNYIDGYSRIVTRPNRPIARGVAKPAPTLDEAQELEASIPF